MTTKFKRFVGGVPSIATTGTRWLSSSWCGATSNASSSQRSDNDGPTSRRSNEDSGSFRRAGARTDEEQGDQEQIPKLVAHFSIDELQKGARCSTTFDDDTLDNYCESFLIRGIKQTHTASDHAMQLSRDWLTRRLFVGKTASSIGDGTRYVVKHIRPEFIHQSQEEFEKAASYLAHEASIMQILRLHPGIATLFGTSIDSTEAYYTNGGRPDAYFIIHENIVEGLEQRIAKWKGKLVRIKAFQALMLGGRGMLNSNPTREERFMAARLGVAFEIADALAYMHQHNIAYRNFGMGKVGFNRNKKVQLIDLGDADTLGLTSIQELAEEETRTTTVLQEDLSTHRFARSISSSEIVTLHAYSAPEVLASGQEWNFSEKSVSFSFTKLLSEILTLNVVGLNPSKNVTVAFVNEFERISTLLPRALLTLLHQGASVNPNIRPTLATFAEAIHLGREVIMRKNKAELKRSSSDLSIHSRQRSTPIRQVSWHGHRRSSRSSGLLAGVELDHDDDPPAG